MRISGQASHWLLALALAGWLLAGLMPEGLRICRQADGRLEIALGCSCDTCNGGTIGDPTDAGCCRDSRCRDFTPASLNVSAGPCCTCDEVSVLTGINLLRQLPDTSIPVTCSVARVRPAGANTRPALTRNHVYRAKAPPGAWAPDTIRLLI